MKSLLICVSVSNANTRRVADRMAEVRGAEVVEPEAVDTDPYRELAPWGVRALPSYRPLRRLGGKEFRPELLGLPAA